jgi:hypothetical protein
MGVYGGLTLEHLRNNSEFSWLRTRFNVGLCEHVNERLGSIKAGNFLTR